MSIHPCSGPTAQAFNYVCTENTSVIEFTLSSSDHSASKLVSNCSLQQCSVDLNYNNSCLLSSAPCFDYRSSNNTKYCAPGILCSILEPCDNVTYNCTSPSSVCIVNSCCSPSSVCLPISLFNFCPPGKVKTLTHDNFPILKLFLVKKNIEGYQ